MNDFDRMVAECAAAGEKLSREHARRGDLRPLLLWYRPSTPEEQGAILLAYNRPVWTPLDGWADTWKLAPEQGKGLGAGVPWSQFAWWVREHSIRLPILKG